MTGYPVLEHGRRCRARVCCGRGFRCRRSRLLARSCRTEDGGEESPLFSGLGRVGLPWPSVPFPLGRHPGRWPQGSLTVAATLQFQSQFQGRAVVACARFHEIRARMICLAHKGHRQPRAVVIRINSSAGNPLKKFDGSRAVAVDAVSALDPDGVAPPSGHPGTFLCRSSPGHTASNVNTIANGG